MFSDHLLCRFTLQFPNPSYSFDGVQVRWTERWQLLVPIPTRLCDRYRRVLLLLRNHWPLKTDWLGSCSGESCSLDWTETLKASWIFYLCVRDWVGFKGTGEEQTQIWRRMQRSSILHSRIPLLFALLFLSTATLLATWRRCYQQLLNRGRASSFRSFLLVAKGSLPDLHLPDVQVRITQSRTWLCGRQVPLVY